MNLLFPSMIDHGSTRDQNPPPASAGNPTSGRRRCSRLWPSLLLTALLAGRAFAQAPEPVGVAHVYKQVAGNNLELWALSPPAHTAKDRCPAVLFFHGGGWVGGPVSQFNRQSEYLAKRGMVAVQVQYRLVKSATDDPITPSIQDAKSSMRWVRSHASELGIDPHRIAAAGASAGGHLAAFLGLVDGIDDPTDDMGVSAIPDAMILFNPAIDLGPDSITHHRGGADYKAVSPLYHVHAGAPPTLVISGGSDPVVPPSLILTFSDAMKKAGARCDTFIYPGQGHGVCNSGEAFYSSLKQMDLFLAALNWLQGPPDEKAIRQLPPKLPPNAFGPGRKTKPAS